MARSVIDSLVVELGLDPKNFTKGQREALDSFKKTQDEVKKRGKETDDIARRNMETMSSATQRVLGFVAAFAGLRAISNFTQEITKLDAATGRTAHNLESSVKDLATWQGAAQRAGGTAEGMTGSIRGLVQEFQMFSLTGQSSVIPWFRALEVDVTDANHKLRPFRDIMLDIADRFQKMGPARAQTFGRAIGFDEGTVNLLMQGRVAVSALLKQQEQLGIVTEADTKRARELQQAWLDLGQAAQALGRDIANAAMPQLTAVLNTMAFILSWWRTPAGTAKADQQGEDLHAKLRRKFGTPQGADNALLGRDVSGTGAGLFGPLSDAISGGGGKPSATLRVKPGAGVDQTHAGTQALARSLQDDIPGLNRFTAGNDAYHRGRPSAHSRGLALDFTVKDRAQAAATAQQVRDRLKAMGINATVIDEYSKPSPFSTGGHIHVQFNSAEDAQQFGARAALRQTSAIQDGAAAAAGGGGGVSTQTSSVTIGSVTVNTQATDAAGIARDMRGAIERDFATQANYGPSG